MVIKEPWTVSSRFFTQPLISLSEDYFIEVTYKDDDGNLTTIKDFKLDGLGESEMKRVNFYRESSDVNNDGVPDIYQISFTIDLTGINLPADIFVAIPMTIVVDGMMSFKMEDVATYQIENFEESQTILSDIIFQQKQILQQSQPLYLTHFTPLGRLFTSASSLSSASILASKFGHSGTIMFDY